MTPNEAIKVARHLSVAEMIKAAWEEGYRDGVACETGQIFNRVEVPEHLWLAADARNDATYAQAKIDAIAAARAAAADIESGPARAGDESEES